MVKSVVSGESESKKFMMPLKGYWEQVRRDDMIHIVEPTLVNESGHCHSFIASLCHVNRNQAFYLWVGKYAHLPDLSGNVQVIKYFFRRIRLIQAYFLYKKLLDLPGRILVSTAGRVDLMLLSWAAKRDIPPKKVYLYFHYVRLTGKKLNYFKKISSLYPNIVILGPTVSTMKVFQDCGFKNTQVVPYPITVIHTESPRQSGFRHLLFAGGAREDKGFSRIVDMIDYLAQRRMQIGFVLQTSPDYYHKYDTLTRMNLSRLKSISYPFLLIHPETLHADEYAKLFEGGICLQPYHRNDFADRISGVTLDALSAGCPVVTLTKTWMGRLVQRFDAGRVIENADPEQMMSAVQTIIDDYSRYQQNAYDAGKVLQMENSADHLLMVLVA